MARPVRIEFVGAPYHITSRGNAREAIYLDYDDRESFLNILSEVCADFNWLVHAYYLILNHYHLLLETSDANLSLGLRQFDGVNTQHFNHDHHRVGHVFLGRLLFH